MIRSVIWGADEGSPITSLILAAWPVSVVGLAYLIPQWVGAPGVLVPSAKEVVATDKIQFVSAVLVAISAGVGFDTVFTRLKNRRKIKLLALQANSGSSNLEALVDLLRWAIEGVVRSGQVITAPHICIMLGARMIRNR